CGNWAYFASRGVIGYFQAYQISKDTAIVTKACSFSPDPGGLASDVRCKTDDANQYRSLSEWKPKQLSYIKICNNKLYNSLLNVYKDPMPSCEQLLADDLKKEKDYKYGADKKQLKAESIKIMTEFFTDCLNEDLSEYQ
ncbi:hypothetical protein, partial [Wohlfahrtiimonas populi]|uniref:hypothetical protein n=1 Tax=Wohlfahrtiimonas populi TaxID=1940240 RepID=UPI0013014B50